MKMRISSNIKHYKDSRNVVIFMAGSWFCGTCAARAGREYRHILLVYISVEFIYVYWNTPILSKLE